MSRVQTLLKEVARIRERDGGGRRPIPKKPEEFAASVGFGPDRWQEEVLRSRHPRKILCCARQSGKTSVAALLAVYKALTSAGSTVLIVAPGERQAKILFSKAASFYRRAGSPYGSISDRRTGLELGNGSVIEALPAVERTVRGYSADLLLLDEAAGVPDHDYFGLLPTLVATKGDQILLSTPRGKRGFFSDIWHDEASGFEKVMVTADDVPHRITEQDLAPFRKRMPKEFFEQEFFCAFLDIEGSLFATADVEAALAAGEDIEAIHFEGDDQW